MALYPDDTVDDLLRRLRAENTSYRSNFEELKSNFEQLEVKCEDLQQQLQAEKTEKLIFQQQHDQIVNEWRSQLDSKALEFDRLREQLQQPQDAETFKYELLQEFEAAAQKRHACLLDQISQYRQRLIDTQRDFENFKLLTATKDRDYRATLEDVVTVHKHELFLLNGKVKERDALADEVQNLENRLRKSQRESTEHSHRAKELFTEIENVRAEAAEQKQSFEGIKRTFERQIADQKAVIETVMSEKESLRTQLERLDLQHQNTLKHEETLSNESIQLRKEVSELQTKCDQLVHSFTVDMKDRDIAVLREKEAWNEERKQLLKQLDEFKIDIEQGKELHRDLVDKQTQLERQADVQIRLAKEEEWAKTRAVESEKRELEARLSKAQQIAQEEQLKIQHEREQQGQDMDRYKNEVQALQLRNQSLISYSDKISSERDQYRLELNDLQQKLARAEAQHTQTHMDLIEAKKREDSATEKIKSLDKNFALLQTEFMDSVESAEKERSKLELFAEKSKREWEREHNHIQEEADRVKSELENTQRQLEEVITTTKKLKTGYKKRLESLQSVLEMHETQVKELDLENRKLKQRIENQNQEASIKLREMHRRQEEFVNFLQGEGLVGKEQIVA